MTTEQIIDLLINPAHVFKTVKGHELRILTMGRFDDGTRFGDVPKLGLSYEAAILYDKQILIVDLLTSSGGVSLLYHARTTLNRFDAIDFHSDNYLIEG